MPNTDRGIAALIVARPLSVLLAFLALVVALGWQARHFEIDASADTLLSDDNEHYIRSQVIQRRFAPQEFLLVAYKPRSHPVLSQETFADLAALSKALSEIDRVASVRSLVNVPLFMAAGSGLSPDTDPNALTIEQRGFSVDAVRSALEDHPIYEGLLINRDHTATALQVLFAPNAELERLRAQMVEIQRQRLDGDLSDEQHAELARLERAAAPLEKRLDETRHEEIERIRAIVAPFEDDAELFLGGAHVLGFQLIDIITTDLVLFGAAIAAMICLLLLLLFRSWRWVLVPLLCCAAGVALSTGLFGLLSLKATVISANFVALQLILTLAIVIHLIVQYREEVSADAQASQAILVQRTLAAKALPCLYAGLTTSVGFASLLLSGIQPVVAFGWMMIVAVFVAIATSLILFPALMTLFGKERTRSGDGVARPVVNGLAALAQRMPAMVGGMSLLIAGAAGAGLAFLSVENSFINYFADSTKVHRELSFIDQELGGTTALDVSYTIPAAERHEDLIMKAETVQRLQRMQRALEQQKGMGTVLSVVNFTELARRVNDDRPLTEYELTALYWMLEDALRDDLLGAFFAPEHEQVRLSARVQDTTPGLDRGALLDDIRADFEALGVSGAQYQLTGLFVLYQDLLDRLFRSQILTLGVVYVALFFAFCAIFRSLSLALIALAPNVLSTISILGFMGWAGIPLDFMTITIAAIAMGIAVDDTIHYIHRYRAERRQQTPREAMQGTHRSVGQALLYTSVVVAAGFSLLMFSDFVPSVFFGLLTALAMVVALVANLTLLGVLLTKTGVR